MVFIPVIAPPPSPSSRARQLSDQIQRLVDDFVRQHPGTNDDDVNAALRLASRHTGAYKAVVVGAVVALIFLLLLTGLLWLRASAAA